MKDGLSFPKPVGELVRGGMTAAKAWRLHLGLQLSEAAASVDFSSEAYERLETQPRLRPADAWIVAKALGIWVGSLDARKLAAT